MMERSGSWAAWFWEAAGGAPPFPREIVVTTPYVLPLAFVSLPELSTRTARRWLLARGLAARLPGPERALHGLLIAQRDGGIVFLNERDPPEEQRFTAAHEVAHYLMDYYAPRERVRQRLGAEVLEALDNGEALSVAQRIDALLADVPLSALIHSVDSLPSGELLCATLQAESSADRLALELLAPAEEVWRRCRTALSGPYRGLAARVSEALRDEFGLPTKVAEAYARRLAQEWTGRRSVREWLGLADGAVWEHHTWNKGKGWTCAEHERHAGERGPV